MIPTQPGEVQFKVWVVEEAEREGVSTQTIHRWKEMGRFKHLTFRHANARCVYVSGPSITLPKMPLKRGPDKQPRRLRVCGQRYRVLIDGWKQSGTRHCTKRKGHRGRCGKTKQKWKAPCKESMKAIRKLKPSANYAKIQSHPTLHESGIRWA